MHQSLFRGSCSAHGAELDPPFGWELRDGPSSACGRSKSTPVSPDTGAGVSLVLNVVAGAYVPGTGRALGAGDDVEPQTNRPEGLPRLARIARQYHNEPATSAGAERLFSAASRAHHDLKGAMNDNSLEHELLALANTD